MLRDFALIACMLQTRDNDTVFDCRCGVRTSVDLHFILAVFILLDFAIYRLRRLDSRSAFDRRY